MQGFADQLAPDGHPVRLIVLRNKQGFSAQFMDWGATWLSCLVPVSKSNLTSSPTGTNLESSLREVLLRSPNLAAHLRQTEYLGATVGRYTNRINRAAYPCAELGGLDTVQLVANDGKNSLHGGLRGFDSRRWQVESCDTTKVTFRLVSADGDQGFPGCLEVRASYELTPDNAVRVTFEASTDKPSPVNLSNHAYFNLAPQYTNVLMHHLQIQADQFVPVCKSGIPRAGLKDVVGTSFDFRAGKRIGQDLLADREQRRVGGYDHGYLLYTDAVNGGLPVATLLAPDAKVQLTMTTTKPALQVYTGNHLGGLLGASGCAYTAHAGIALETEFLPDAPNHPEWPHASSILLPGQRYFHQTTFHLAS